MRRSVPLLAFAWTMVATLALGAAAADVDRGPIWRPSAPVAEETGAVGLYQSLLKLPVVASIASIGAHPDDDDSGALAYLSRGLLARTANVVANRGEGGQNAIGPELYLSLGVIRTEELLAARRLDGAEQYFLHAYDFGFSKSREETLERWGREATLSDLVRFIRTWRPDVILNHHWNESETYTGHGHHQAMGVLVAEAIELAADPTAFPEQIAEGLFPWKTPRVYGRGGPNPQVRFDRGEYDPVLGRSYAQLGAESRSYHRTQTMGQLQTAGSSFASWTLLTDNVGGFDPAGGIFSGFDTTLAGIADLAGEEEAKAPLLRVRLAAIQQSVERILARFNPLAPETIVPDLVEVLRDFRKVRDEVDRSDLSAMRRSYITGRLDLKIQETEEVLMKATGLLLEVFTPEERYVPGEQIKATVSVYNRSTVPVTVQQIGLSALPSGQTVTQQNKRLSYNEKLSAQLQVTVPLDAPTSRVYWRIPDGPPGSQGRTIVPEDEPELINQPFRPHPVAGFADVAIGDQVIRLERTAEYRLLDRVTGEFRRPTSVVEPISVRLNPANRALAVSAEPRTLNYTVQLVSNVDSTVPVTVRLEIPQGMRVEPASTTVTLGRKGASTSVTFTVTVPAGLSEGAYRVRAVAEALGRQWTQGYQEISYPHIEPHYVYTPAESTLSIFQLATIPNLRIGYVMGQGDGIPDALAQVGIPVTLIDSEMLATGDLSQFDTIVTAPLAYEFRPDLVSHNDRLLEWVRSGGVLIVQYNRYPWNNLNVAPYPTFINSPHDRVTLEEAPVEILVPENPVFQSPNRITARDFEGWQQERGLYFIGKWDERYTPLLSSHDPGEPDKQGGLLYTRYGKGAWVYTGYAFFRQLPGGVAGAYRLFVNLLSLPATLD